MVYTTYGDLAGGLLLSYHVLPTLVPLDVKIPVLLDFERIQTGLIQLIQHQMKERSWQHLPDPNAPGWATVWQHEKKK